MVGEGTAPPTREQVAELLRELDDIEEFHDDGDMQTVAGKATVVIRALLSAGPPPNQVFWEGPAEDVDIVEQGRLPSIINAVGRDDRVRVVAAPRPHDDSTDPDAEEDTRGDQTYTVFDAEADGDMG